MSSTKELIESNKVDSLAIMEPRNIRKRPIKKALEEEVFTDALTHIIRRDFFPDIPKVEAQLEYIEATESNDQQKLREISARFGTVLQTPVPATPSAFGTPAAGAASNTADHQSREQDRDPTGLTKPKPEDDSLDKFLSKYQSEDDASFGELMVEAQVRRRQKYAWLYEQEQKAKLALQGPQECLAITCGDEDSVLTEHGAIKTWTYTSKNSLMYIPEGAPDTLQEAADRVINARSVVHSNTRLPREFKRKIQAGLSGTTEGAKPDVSKEKIGVDGRVLGEGESPSVNGYGFVATPQIHPGVDASPLMTWGVVEGTPFRLDAGDFTPGIGPTFKMPKTTRREEIALELAEKVNTANRERKKAALRLASSPSLQKRLGTPASLERLRLLSPAAQKLVSRASTPGSLHVADKALRASYTPRLATQGTPLATARVATPSCGHITTSKPNSPPSSSASLTDNLLNLKNR